MLSDMLEEEETTESAAWGAEGEVGLKACSQSSSGYPRLGIQVTITTI